MTIWFTSDEHYGHANIIKYSNRPFKSVDEMTEQLIVRHNSLVNSEDLVIHVGDFVYKKSMLPFLLSELNGRHALVAGNHDGCHQCHKNYEAQTKRYLDAGFITVAQSTQVEIFDVCHLPYAGNHYEGQERYAQWRPQDTGKILLHGHVHEKWRWNGRQINVGVDVWDYHPVSLESLKIFAKEFVSEQA